MPVHQSSWPSPLRSATGLLFGVLFCWLASLQAQPYGLALRPTVGHFFDAKFPAAPPSVSSWQAQVAFPNLTFDDPISIVPEPGTNRLFVCERQGKIWHFPNVASTTNKVLFLDLTPVTQGYNDCGVLGLAFHPQYSLAGSTNRYYVYIYYSFSPSPIIPPPGSSAPSVTNNYNRLSRFTVTNTPAGVVAVPASEQILINQFDRHLWHNGGGMFFDPDGFLYLSNGDEGGTQDGANGQIGYNQTQKINSGLFSGVLRIDVDKDPSRSHAVRRQPVGATPPPGWPPTYSSNYFIPNDNPWLNTNGTVLEEFWAIGLRSPHRMTYDAVSDRIWLGDVGQATWEEVDIIVKGGNYQWAYQEGSHTGFKAKPSPLIGADQPPIHDYQHINGNDCVIGGYVYRGSQFPSLYGKYLFGDNGSGRVWTIDYDGVNPAVVTQILTMPAFGIGLTSFGVDHNNEILMSMGGEGAQIYKLAASGAVIPPPPALLSQTGVFSDTTNLVPNAKLIPFDVTAPLWSDNATKARWMVVPNDGAPYTASETIAFTTNGNWTFPTGSVLIKHFNLPVNDTNPAALKRLETRFLVRGTNGAWHGFTYKWRADNSDADLLPGALEETNIITTATGTRSQVWYYPSPQDCLQCHTANSGQVLGPRTSLLNEDYTYPGTGDTDNQLRALNHVGMFNVSLNEAGIPALPKTAHITDTNATPELRVRSYLQSNCSHCHQPGGVQANFDARFSTPLNNQGLTNAIPNDSLGIAGARIIAPQHPEKSVFHLRDSIVGPNQMPPLAKNMVDTNYISVLGEWINGLPLPPLPPPDVLGRIGNTNSAGTSDNIWNNNPYINAGRFTSASNLTVAFIHANVAGITGRYQCAIYADNAAQPSTLLVTSLAVTNPVTGWQKMPLSAPLSLTSNTSYWLAIWSDSTNARVFYNTSGGTLRWGQYIFTNVWPTPLVTSGGSIANYNIYASGGNAPVFAGTPTNRTITELTLVTVTNAATDADTPFQQITYALANPPAGAAIDSNGVITWTPSEAQSPSTNSIVTVANDGVVAITNSFVVTVTEANAAPIAFSQSLTNAEDTALPIVLTGSDPDGPAMDFIVVTNPVNGSLSGVAPILAYQPNTNYFGNDVFAFRINDGSLTSAVAFVLLTTTNVNDAPTASGSALTVTEDESSPITLNITDPDGTDPALNLVIVTHPAHGLLSGSISNLTYTPDTNFFGADNFAYEVDDGSLTSVLATVSLTVTNVNDTPSPEPDQFVRWLSQGFETSAPYLLTNDMDMDGDLLTIESVNNPSLEGAAVILTNAIVQYWPQFGNTNADAFTYLVSDGHGSLATGIVNVAVQPDPPVNEMLGIVTGTGTYQLSFTGVPGFTYTVQYTDALDPANWQNLGTVTADELGNVQLEDTTSGNGPSRFYRSVRGIAP